MCHNDLAYNIKITLDTQKLTDKQKQKTENKTQTKQNKKKKRHASYLKTEIKQKQFQVLR